MSAYMVWSPNMYMRTPPAVFISSIGSPDRIEPARIIRRRWVLFVPRRRGGGYRLRLLGSRKRKELTRRILDSLPKWRPAYPEEQAVPGRPGAAVILVRADS